jgi:hypothetical protein
MDRVLALVQAEGDPVDPITLQPANPVTGEMFDSVGVVTVEALSKLMRRFEKVDAFSR